MYRVLIVDDDKLARKGLISIVPWADCSMEVVGDVPNGQCALDFLRQAEADLVVVDMSMPVMSGLELIQAAQKLYPRLEYVVLSFYESFEYVQSALRLGALDYISKLRLEEEDCLQVFRRVRGLLDRRRSGDSGHSPAASPEELNALRDRWCSLHWMYDASLLEAMVEDLRGAALPPAQLEKLFFWTAQSLEEHFGGRLDLPSFPRGEAYLDWILRQRREILERCLDGADRSRLPVCMLAAAEQVRRRVAQPLKSDEVAAWVGMSRSYFSTNFKRFTGHTFHDYVRRQRITLAKELLREENLTTAELAERVGYEDSKYFARLFQEHEGVSCSQFRKQISRQ